MSSYLIVGAHRIDGAEPGETIEIEDDAHASFLTAAGHIQPVGGTPAPDEGTTQEEGE